MRNVLVVLLALTLVMAPTVVRARGGDDVIFGAILFGPVLFVGLVVVSALVLVHATTGWRPGWCDTHRESALYEPLCDIPRPGEPAAEQLEVAPPMTSIAPNLGQR